MSLQGGLSVHQEAALKRKLYKRICLVCGQPIKSENWSKRSEHNKVLLCKRHLMQHKMKQNPYPKRHKKGDF